MPAEERALPLVDGELRMYAPDRDEGDLGVMYVLDVLGVSVLVRERDGDVYVHIETQDSVSTPGPDKGVVYEVNNNGEHEVGL